MGLAADFRALWREGGWLTRGALVTFGVSVAINLLALAGVSTLDIGYAPLYIPHIAVMVLGFATVAQGADKRYRDFRRRYPFGSPWPIPIRRRVVLLEAFVALNLAGWVLYSTMTTGPGSAEPHDGGYAWMNRGEVVRELTYAEYHRANANFLAVFSAAWCFFSLGIALIHHRYAVRMRQLRGDAGAPATLTPGPADAIVPPCPPQTSPASSTSSAPPKR